MPGHRVGVALRLAVLAVGERRLRDQGPQARLVGVARQRLELLVGHPQLVPQRLAAARRHLAQTAFDERAAHVVSVRSDTRSPRASGLGHDCAPHASRRPVGLRLGLVVPVHQGERGGLHAVHRRRRTHGARLPGPRRDRPLHRHRSAPPDAAYWQAVAFAGIVGTAVPFTLLAWGEERITSALTAVAQSTTALFTALFAALLLGERLRRIQVAGLPSACSAWPSPPAWARATSPAPRLPACWPRGGRRRLRHHLRAHAAAAARTSRRWWRRPASSSSAPSCSRPFALVTSALSGMSPTPARVSSLVLLGVVNTGIAYWLNYGAIAEVGATCGLAGHLPHPARRHRRRVARPRRARRLAADRRAGADHRRCRRGAAQPRQRQPVG